MANPWETPMPTVKRASGNPWETPPETETPKTEKVMGIDVPAGAFEGRVKRPTPKYGPTEPIKLTEALKGLGTGYARGVKQMTGPAFDWGVRKAAGKPEATKEEISQAFEQTVPEAQDPNVRAIQKTGELGAKIIQGTAASAAVPGAGLPTLLGQAAVAELPFLAESMQEGADKKSLASQMALAMAFDLATAGLLKGAPQLKQKLIQKGIDEKLATQTAEDAWKRLRGGTKGFQETKKAIQKGQAVKLPSFDVSNKIQYRSPSTAVPETIEEAIEAGVDPTMVTPKKFLGGTPAGMDPSTASTLGTAAKPTTTPFSEHAKLAEMARYDRYNKSIPHPLDMVGRKLVQGLQTLKSAGDDLGKRMKTIITEGDKAMADKGVLLSSQPIKDQWLKLLRDRGNLTIDTKGALKVIPGETVRIGKNDAMLREVHKRIMALPQYAELKNLADLNTGIREAVTSAKSRQVSPAMTVAEGLSNSMRQPIREAVAKGLGDQGPAYMQTAREYAMIKNLQDNLNRRIGEDVGEGQSRMGASFLKSTIQSMADRGGKVMLKRLEELTGLDIIQDATYALQAMYNAGDPRALNLLEEVRKSGLDVPGMPKVVKGATGLASAAKKLVTKDPLTKMVQFSEKQAQQRAAQESLPEILKSVGMGPMSRGAAGAGLGGAVGYATPVETEEERFRNTLKGIGLGGAAGVTFPHILKKVANQKGKGLGRR